MHLSTTFCVFCLCLSGAFQPTLPTAVGISPLYPRLHSQGRRAALPHGFSRLVPLFEPLINDACYGTHARGNLPCGQRPVAELLAP